jgi:hypothetical protein
MYKKCYLAKQWSVSKNKYKLEVREVSGQTRALKHTGSEIMCPVSTPCWPVKPIVSPVSWSYKRGYPPSRLMCPVMSNYRYESCETTFGLIKVCNSKVDNCKDHRTCETLSSNKTAKIPVTWTWLSIQNVLQGDMVLEGETFNHNRDI